MSVKSKNLSPGKGEQTRALILTAALELFAVKGYHGASIDEIARKSGISKGLAYHYFQNKKGLLRAIVDHGFAKLDDLMASALTITDPLQQIIVILERTLTATKKDEHFWRLYFGLVLQGDVWAEFGAMFNEMFQQYSLHFEHLFEQIGAADPRAEAHILGALLDGIGLHLLIRGDAYPLEQVKNRLIVYYSQMADAKQRKT